MNSKTEPVHPATVLPADWTAETLLWKVTTPFPVENQEYIALLPLDENGQNQSGEVYLYKFSRTETGDPILANIESDDEYAKAAEAFDVVLDNARKAEAAGEPLE